MFSLSTAKSALLLAFVVLLLFSSSVYPAEHVFLDPGEDSFSLPYRLVIENKLDVFTDAGNATTGFWGLYRNGSDTSYASYRIVNRWKFPDTNACIIFYNDLECTEAVWHYNFPASTIFDCFAIDTDIDGTDEIATFYRYVDTIWLEILDVPSKTSHRVPLSHGTDLDGSGHWDGSGRILAAGDIDHDYKPELFINVDVGYDLYPRELICFSPSRDTCLWRFEISGIVSASNFYITPLHPGGPPRIIMGICSKGNAAVVGDMDDLHSYLIVLDEQGQLQWMKTLGFVFSTGLPVPADIDSNDSLEILVPVRNDKSSSTPDSAGSLCLFSETGDLVTTYSWGGDKHRWVKTLTVLPAHGNSEQIFVAAYNDGCIATYDKTLTPMAECSSAGPLDLISLVDILDTGDRQILMSTGDRQFLLVNKELELMAMLPIEARTDISRVKTLPPETNRPTRVIVSTDYGASFLTISARHNSWLTIFNRRPWLAFLAAFLPLFLLLTGALLAWRHTRHSNRVIKKQQEELSRTLAGMEEVKDKLRAARKLAEARNKLHIQEENLRTIVENSLQGVIVCQGNMVYSINSVVSELAGANIETLRGMSVYDAVNTFVFPDDRLPILNDYEALANNRTSRSRREIRILDQTGGIHWVDMFAHVTNFEGRQSIIVMIVDISLRQIALDKLQESEESATATLNATDDLVSLCDTRLGIIRANKALQDVLGKNENKLVGTYLLTDFPPRIQSHRLEIVKRVIDSGQPVDFEDSFDGHHYSHIAYPVKNSYGRVTRIVLYCRDITELRNQVNELRHLRAAIEQTIAGIAIADNDGNISYANGSWASMHGYEPQELIGKHLSIFHSPEQLQDEVKPFNSIAVEHGSHYGQVGHCHRNGHCFPTIMSSTVIKDEGGQQQGLVGTAIDISDQQVLEIELQKKKRQLEWITSQLIKLQEADRRFVARELHDSIAQQLSVVKMMVEQLRIKGANNGDSELFERLADMITETMRDTRRISSHLRPRMMDTLGLIATMEWYLGQLPTNIDVHFHVEGDDSGLDQDLAINLFRVFQELVLNVTRHAQATQLSVNLHLERNSVALDFMDNGCGFNLSEITANWEKKQNFGILNIAERVQMVGGTIKIDTSPGQGTRFLIETPLSGGNLTT
ncbi:MAG TPA: PAS domain S-box protein [candidate division Zixibacteria bacterium]|nr:PAS domain S-box protein [candidate division Zixibacteria bacterium]